MGAVLVICVENDDNYKIKEWKAVVVDGETVKADTWYTLKDGELVEAFLDVMERHKMVVENAGLLTVAALHHL